MHKRAEFARKAIGLKGKMFAKKRHAEKAQMKKTIAMHEEKDSKKKADDGAPQNAVPAYLLERDQVRLDGLQKRAPEGVSWAWACRQAGSLTCWHRHMPCGQGLQAAKAAAPADSGMVLQSQLALVLAGAACRCSMLWRQSMEQMTVQHPEGTAWARAEGRLCKP